MNGKYKFHSPDGPAFNSGEVWYPTDGSQRSVEVVTLHRYGGDKWDVMVYYISCGRLLNKDAWNFQVRYSHIADNYI